MKKILIYTLAVLSTTIFGANGIYAAEDGGQIGSGRILVSEKPLGATCQCAIKNPNAKPGDRDQFIIQGEANDTGKTCNVPISQRLYVCTPTSLNQLIQGIVSWIIQIALLLGVLATAVLGVMWAITGADNPEAKKKLKDWLIWLVIGLVIIYWFQYILGIFGWIYTTNL